MSHINDDNWQFLSTATGLSTTYNDMYFAYLRGLGYTGSLQDMIAASGLGMSPASSDLLTLFSNGENGFLFDPMSDLDRLFNAINGTSQVANDNDTVALMLDKAKWGGKNYSQLLAYQTERKSTGTTFTNGTGPAATYDPQTGVGSVARTDVNNNSQVRFAFTPGSIRVELQNTGATTLQIRNAGGGGTLSSIGAGQTLAVIVTEPTGLIRLQMANDGTSTTFVVLSVKEIPGNHVSQATSTKRPLWKANAGKSYLQADAADDFLQVSLTPGSAGTMVAAFRSGTAGCSVLAGGQITGDKRARLGLAPTTGFADFAFNTTGKWVGSVDLRDADVVLAQTWGGGVYRTYANGTLLSEQAAVANMDGTGNGYTLLSQEGGTTGFGNTRLYAALILDRLATPTEISRITSTFQQRF